MTFDAQIMDCVTAADAVPISPDWFSIMTITIDGELVCPVLVEPNARSVDFDNVLFLHLNPEAPAPVPLPLGIRVHVTGQFDNPAAQQCVSDWLDDPVLTCRTQFVVTAVAVAS